MYSESPATASVQKFSVDVVGTAEKPIRRGGNPIGVGRQLQTQKKKSKLVGSQEPSEADEGEDNPFEIASDVVFAKSSYPSKLKNRFFNKYWERATRRRNPKILKIHKIINILKI